MGWSTVCDILYFPCDKRKSHFHLKAGRFNFTVIQSAINITMPARKQGSASNYPDLITHLLAYLLSLVPSIDMSLEDVAVISRQISLVLVGVIILSSMRLVLRGVTRVRSTNIYASNDWVADSIYFRNRRYGSQVVTLERH